MEKGMQVYKNFNPLVSIILPTFNREKLLDRSINSVVNQNFKSWELIIVDDGSSDNTFDLVNSYLSDYENVRYIKHSNRKLPLSLNAGILLSVGKYICFLGSDDEYKPSYIEERVNFMIENSNVDLIYGGAEIIGNPFVKDKNDLTKEIHLSNCVIGGTFFGKRKVFIDLKGFKDLKYSEDSDFYERAIQKFKVVKVGFQSYIYYRDTPDSICNTIE
ncbi:MAG: glycosyltransferase family 2 protein [Stygiobacter sp.]